MSRARARAHARTHTHTHLQRVDKRAATGAAPARAARSKQGRTAAAVGGSITDTGPHDRSGRVTALPVSLADRCGKLKLTHLHSRQATRPRSPPPTLSPTQHVSFLPLPLSRKKVCWLWWLQLLESPRLGVGSDTSQHHQNSWKVI